MIPATASQNQSKLKPSIFHWTIDKFTSKKRTWAFPRAPPGPSWNLPGTPLNLLGTSLDPPGPQKRTPGTSRPFGNSKSIKITSNLWKSLKSESLHPPICRTCHIFTHTHIYTHIHICIYTHICTHKSFKLYENPLKRLSSTPSICRMYRAPLRLRYMP